MNKSKDRAPLIISKERFDGLWGLFSRHPFIITAVICVYLTGFGYQNNMLLKYFTEFTAAAVIGLCLYRCIRRLLDRRRSKALAVGIFILECAVSIVMVKLYLESDNRAELVYVLGAGAVCLLALLCIGDFIHYGNGYLRRLAVMTISLWGFVMRLGYVLETPIIRRQNDVHQFGGPDGHSAYIEYIAENLSFPDVDPTTVWQFYHPPLHHSICAVWLRLLKLIDIPYDVACESLQAVSLFCSLSCIILFYKLLRFFRLRGLSLSVPFAIVVFHPSLVILSGSINNDIMSVTFILASVYMTARWYKAPCFKNIIKLAFCIGLGMMTKLSAGLVAPAVAVVFLIVLIKNRSQFKSLMLQFLAFGGVCAPLGLWWGIRNLIRFGTPLTYVPSLPITSSQYIGDIPTKTRLFDFSFYQFSDVFEQWTVKTYQEFNPTVAFLKNSLFGEHMRALTFEGSLIAYPKTLFWVAMALAVISFISLVAVQFSRGNRPVKLMLFILEATLLTSYYKFCFEYPFICTMNFRYIVPCLFIGAAAIGLVMKKLDAKGNAVCCISQVAVTLLSAVMCVMSFLTYFVLISSLS